MTNTTLAASYLKKARARLKALDVLVAEGAHSDVVREAQEIVELACKGLLRHAGIEPPKWHDVGELLQTYEQRFAAIADRVRRLAEISARLRKEREFSFYGDIDFIPTERYSQSDAETARAEATFAVEAAAVVIEAGSPSEPDGPPRGTAGRG